MSRVSFYFLKNLYLDQLSDQVNTVSKMISNRIDTKFLDILQIGTPTAPTEKYFHQVFSSYKKAKSDGNIFIFDSDLNIILHSDSTVTKGIPEPRLLLNQSEIENLKINEASTSLPFKGDDGKWYLWGFFRLSDKFWLGVQESAVRLENVDKFSNIFWIIGLAGIIITIILGWIAANSITKPINRLVDFSTEIGKGNNSFSAPVDMKGELEILSNAMDKMRKNLLTNQKEKENILAQIAHEIRNPLGGIELFAGLIKEDLQKSSKSTEYPNRILSEVNRLKSLTTAYLNYSRPVKAIAERINLSDMVEELQNIFSERIKEKRINMIKEIELETIYFDNGHLKQILMNLLSNSIDSVQCEGTVKLSALENHNKWQITIQDDGSGIKTENLNKIFEPFFTTKKDGTGLGLAVSKKLSIENNAELTVENASSSGCKFILSKEYKNESL